MSLASSALDVGKFLLEHADIVEDIVTVLRAGAPKDMIRTAIQQVQVKVSDDAIREELEEAEKRKA